MVESLDCTFLLRRFLAADDRDRVRSRLARTALCESSLVLYIILAVASSVSTRPEMKSFSAKPMCSLAEMQLREFAA